MGQVRVEELEGLEGGRRDDFSLLFRLLLPSRSDLAPSVVCMLSLARDVCTNNLKCSIPNTTCAVGRGVSEGESHASSRSRRPFTFCICHVTNRTKLPPSRITMQRRAEKVWRAAAPSSLDRASQALVSSKPPEPHVDRLMIAFRKKKKKTPVLSQILAAVQGFHHQAWLSDGWQAPRHTHASVF